jgi:phosphatidylglycerophosphatase C
LPAACARPVVAAFDFDGTLSAGTSGIRFFREVLGTRRVLWMGLRHGRAALHYAFRHRDEESLELFTRYVFRGRSAAAVQAAALRFARDVVPQHLLPAGLERLRAHLARGDRCAIVSRGYAWCIEPWAAALGIHDVLATELEIGADGRLTGRMRAPSCDGEQKRSRLLALLGDREKWELHAYGDSPGDTPMLALADRAYLRRGDTFVPWRA